MINPIAAVRLLEKRSSVTECFTKLIDELDLLQRGIEHRFAEPFYLHENIIRTIRDHSAEMTEFINSSNDVVDLISNLHSFIINYETVHRSLAHENYVQFYNDEVKNEKIENETYFIDRRY